MRLRFLTSPVEIGGDDRVESIVVGRNQLTDRRTGRSRGRHRRAGDPGGRARPARGRLPGRRLPGVPFDSRPASSPTATGGSRRRPGVRRRMDQARSERHHRHQPEMCDGDRPYDRDRPRRSPPDVSRCANGTLLEPGCGKGNRRWSTSTWLGCHRCGGTRARDSGRAAPGSSSAPGTGCSRPRWRSRSDPRANHVQHPVGWSGRRLEVLPHSTREKSSRVIYDLNPM